MAGARHVWTMPPHLRTWMPGLLLAWRQSDREWQGLTAYVLPGDRVVIEWVPAASLRPLDVEVPSGGSAYG